jgi:ABC-2 type transport system ATP-binding protein
MTSDTVDADAVAELRGVHKRYKKVEALRGVDLRIHQGELVALLGSNGAGKTTTVSILLGQRRPDIGTARLFGRDPTLPVARRPVAATPQESGFPDNLTVGEVVDLVRAHYANPAATPALLERFAGQSRLVVCRCRPASGSRGGDCWPRCSPPWPRPS